MKNPLSKTAKTCCYISLFAMATSLTACDKPINDANEAKKEQANGHVKTAANQDEYQRIVVMSPDVANIVISLGAIDKIVGKDAMNKHPKLNHVPEVGTHRNISPESIISVNPDLVLGSHMVQPQTIYNRLEGLGLKAVNVAPKADIEVFAQSIETIGNLVGKPEEGKKLSTQWLEGMQPREQTKTRYLLSYDGRFVSGKNTVADDLIKRAGGINAASSVEGLKPLSREGWLDANPDVVIIADHNKAIVGSQKQFASRPEIANSPAAKNDKVIFWPVRDFMVFGLYSPNIVDKLHKLAHE
ncbi:ABC transporter substrate-binding protein [Psychrobacter sp. HD31]|uniref:heme/hemin ABC transporter substrate-binding protein n=1 Tax=Psychrobacter sp. HD31 TaxID=3112003 RepID=UPI003DA38CE8